MTLHPLLNHIQAQQDRVGVLRDLLRCMSSLADTEQCPELRIEMTREAARIASEVNTALDIVNLPELEAA